MTLNENRYMFNSKVITYTESHLKYHLQDPAVLLKDIFVLYFCHERIGNTAKRLTLVDAQN